ncbi:voltage gated chloride channel [Colletotrichum scovillei]|uniref:Chloride channel protein n=1 Tax=Colletotrichum scovillei TaxID=1209932 RepID=A0A9P7REQ8_9PEZI|nr:voltage gated chloride channel [Colletotrichum scovillei]KAF4785698.1 voltage gated chloride channel [Colletotrichum scovillei]KAG7054661.1 Chloride channel protein [Colletotrichum scovillei]KAG7074103.1 Chloride channel protein [Colletotrichum scovillei]KAG7081405.1 Chloride channel protein [Colletotrichum scovillei]
MASDDGETNENSPLLPTSQTRQSTPNSSHQASLSKADQALGQSPPLGDRLPYNDYTTIDWLRDLTKDSSRARRLRARPGIRGTAVRWFDQCQGWIAAAVIGALTALVAFVVDVSVATVSDWKEGYCRTNVFLDRGRCCWGVSETEVCDAWKPWVDEGEGRGYAASYAVYVLFALLFGIVAGNVTMTTKASLPAVDADTAVTAGAMTEGKTMYMAAGSGIPEIKTILSGFVIPHFLDFKVLVVKAVGATFAVSTGMCLGKEGPFVHISTCVGWLVANRFPKYRDNPRKMREMLSVACSSGLSVAFGAPIGGVLFSYEEISTYFPRRVLWRAFLCSLIAAIALKALNPTGTGKLVLFETSYGVDYDPVHYLVFVLLGVVGGVFGGVFCKANFLWSKRFRRYDIVKKHPVLELCCVVLATALLQYPNVLIRDTGDVALSRLLVDCKEPDGNWICQQERSNDKRAYMLQLASGTVIKLLLTIITFGCKVPSGIIIPALDGGALFGRLVGQFVGGISPGIFAMVGAAAFLAGVSRMTVSLAVIMFELTGEVTYVPAFMCAILTAKWVADAISGESVYDLSQHLLGHPFLDAEQAHEVVRKREATARELVPPAGTMEEITLGVGSVYRVRRDVLAEKLRKLKARGLMDAGLVLVNDAGLLFGYLPEAEVEYAVLTGGEAEELDLRTGVMTELVDRTPLTICAEAPMEHVLEMFGKLGPRYIIILEPETSKVLGVVLKKRLLDFLDRVKAS